MVSEPGSIAATKLLMRQPTDVVCSEDSFARIVEKLDNITMLIIARAAQQGSRNGNYDQYEKMEISDTHLQGEELQCHQEFVKLQQIQGMELSSQFLGKFKADLQCPVKVPHPDALYKAYKSDKLHESTTAVAIGYNSLDADVGGVSRHLLSRGSLIDVKENGEEANWDFVSLRDVDDSLPHGFIQSDEGEGTDFSSDIEFGISYVEPEPPPYFQTEMVESSKYNGVSNRDGGGQISCKKQLLKRLLDGKTRFKGSNWEIDQDYSPPWWKYQNPVADEPELRPEPPPLEPLYTSQNVVDVSTSDSHVNKLCCISNGAQEGKVDEELDTIVSVCIDEGQLDAIDFENAKDTHEHILVVYNLPENTWVSHDYELIHSPPLTTVDSCQLEEFDPFWRATLHSTIEAWQRLILLNLVSTCNIEFFLNSMTQWHLKFILQGGHVLLGRKMVQAYESFNGSGSLWLLMRSYYGFNGPGNETSILVNTMIEGFKLGKNVTHHRWSLVHGIVSELVIRLELPKWRYPNLFWFEDQNFFGQFFLG